MRRGRRREQVVRFGSSWIGDTASDQGRALLQEQYRALRRQIPVMYIVMCVNSTSLSLATFGSVHPAISVGLPLALSLASLARMFIWIRRRNLVPSPARIRRWLTSTLAFGTLLAAGFVLWSFLLFPNANQVQRTCIGLFMFTATICCCFCLQSFPPAARAMLVVGTVPVSLLLLFEGDPLLRGLGMNLIFVAVLIHRILRTNHAGFVEVLRSRSTMQAERERALLAERRAHDLAYQDPLTTLPNRRALGEDLEQWLHGCMTRQPVALMIVDLDRFKAINDVHGHPAGDLLLRQVANRLRALAGQQAQAYRLGGDEFAILFRPPFRRASLQEFAEQLVSAIAVPIGGDGVVHHVGASVGIATYPRDACDRETLMRKADIALYEAKLGGRSAFRLFKPEMEALIRHRSSIEQQLRADVGGDALTPFLQPVVDLRTGEIVGFELLARWLRNGCFAVGPDQFIPVAEECGLINELMLALLEKGCRFASLLQESRPIAINISPVQLKDPLLAEKILAVLDRCHTHPTRLGIEITENALIADGNSARRTIEALKARGVQVALDDFGTGYSSLQHLHRLPFDKIKIDRSFITCMNDEPEALKIVRAIISLASSFNLCVVAEGVETEEVARSLQALGCEQAQGFHFGRPFPAHMAAAVLARSGRRDLSTSPLPTLRKQA